MKWRRLLITVLSSMAITSSCFAQSVDFSAIDRFWPIYDLLKYDRQPSLEQWDALFESPGLAALEEREHRRQALKRAYQLSYMPSKQDSFSLVVEGGGFLGHILPHLVRIPVIRDTLATFQSRLRSTDLLGEALQLAQGLLPDGLTQQHAPPPIAFVFFARDGRGYPHIIVADLLNIMKSRNRTGFFAHELHHYYRNYVTELNGEFDDDDYYLMYVLINLEEEGIADLLDKADLPTLTAAELKMQIPDMGRRDFFERYRRHYAEANEWLEQIELVFQRVAESPYLSAQEGKKLHGELPIGGRPIGAFMASVIIGKLGRDRLIEVVGDPFGFWRRYNEAAAASGEDAHVLSGQAMGLLNRLETRYGRRDW